MQLLPIQQRIEENVVFMKNPLLLQVVQATVGFYTKVGFVPPWIGYCAEENGNIIGSAGFKGPPVNGRVEIAYGTREEYQHQGWGTVICRQLVNLALQTVHSIKITARTILQENFSTRILVKNNFICCGTVTDPEAGEVWEWLYKNE